MQNDYLYGKYRTKTLTDIWKDYEAFENDLIATPLYDDEVEILQEPMYYLLYARYGNSHIANSDETQFKYRVFSIVYEYGPTLAKHLEIQKSLRELSLTEGDLFEGAKMIYNHSYNPSSAPSTNTLDELQTINDQNVTKNKRNKLDAYTYLYNALNDDLWKKFIDRFKKLFLTIVQPEAPLLYANEIEENV